MSYHWSIHQLTEYFVAVSSPPEAPDAVTAALEHSAEALEAEFGVVTMNGVVMGAFGFGDIPVPEEFLAAPDGGMAEILGLGQAYLVTGRLDTPDGQAGTPGARLVIGRIGEGYSAEERQMLQGMALVLGLRLQSLATLAMEQQRHRLVEHLLQIQRAISARRPLEEVLDAVTSGASSLLGDAPVALMLSDPANPEHLRVASTHHLPQVDEALLKIARRALAGTPETADASGEHRMIAERVIVSGEVAGCLVARRGSRGIGGHDPGELLSAFAQQVNLALTDARTLNAVREAHRDPVTSLPNRTLFLERLDQERQTALAEESELTVLFIDLDRFKAVNDTLGHRAGDQLLAEVAHRILTCVSDQDVVARLGGDEFAVLLRGGDRTVGGRVAERIIAALTRTFSIQGRDVLIGASVGVAELSDSQQSAHMLLSDADVAMYCAKRSGRGRWVAFEPKMHEEVAGQLSLRTDLQHAEALGQLWVAYQPIMTIASGEIEGVEALLRWNHPTRGPIPPSDFIPIAEESDTITMLGTFVMREALAQLARWRQTLPHLHLAINVSWRQVVDPQLAVMLAEGLERHRLPGSAVTVEVTESLLMSEPDKARGRLADLKGLGVRLSIDDFGTGYSSLSYLRQFPVDQVKIDRSFVSGLRPDATSDIALLGGILGLCHSLGLQTVAEGIEVSEELRILAELGCSLGQGHYFARPAPAQALQPQSFASAPFPGVRPKAGMPSRHQRMALP